MTASPPEVKAAISFLLTLGAVLAVVALGAWLPSAPAALRHWVRHWGRILEPGCNRCALRTLGILAEGHADDAFAAGDRRVLARIALGKVGTP